MVRLASIVLYVSEMYDLLIAVLRVESILKLISKEVFPRHLWDRTEPSNNTSK